MVHQDVEVDDPDANELLVQVVACGLCEFLSSRLALTYT